MRRRVWDWPRRTKATATSAAPPANCSSWPGSDPGTILGGWALAQLSELLGRSFVLSDLARRLDELILSIAAFLDDCMRDGSRAVTFAGATDLADDRPV